MAEIRYFRLWNFIRLRILRYLCRAIFLRLFLITLPIHSPPVSHSRQLVITIIAQSIINWQSGPASRFVHLLGYYLRSQRNCRGRRHLVWAGCLSCQTKPWHVAPRAVDAPSALRCDIAFDVWYGQALTSGGRRRQHPPIVGLLANSVATLGATR